MKKRTAVLFSTHVINRHVRSHFQQLRRECPPDFELFLFFDEERIPFWRAAWFAGLGKVIPHLTNGWKRFKRPGVELKSKIPGNEDGMLFSAIERLPGYDWYWYIEYDVAFTGDWRDFFAEMQDSDADLLAVNISPYDEIPSWNWWPALEVPVERTLPRSEWIRVFLPISRFSKRLFDVLAPVYAEGWAGHWESLIGTLAQAHGLIVEDIGGDGAFTREKNRNRFYRSTRAQDYLSPGTFVFRPSFNKPGKEPNMLWHPVKKRSEADWDHIGMP